MRIDIWSDVVCPWCYIGKRRFDAALSRLVAEDSDLESRLDIAYRAYQLDPTAPVDVATPVRDVYARKFGGPERAEAIFEQMTATAAAEGVTFDFGRALRANTKRAHRLLWWVRANHGYPAQSAVKENLMAAYFTDGRDIGSIDTLVDIASTTLSDLPHVQIPSLDAIRSLLTSDVGSQEVEADLLDASDHGITGVPTYVINGQWSIPGAQDSDTFERVLRRALEREAAQ